MLLEALRRRSRLLRTSLSATMLPELNRRDPPTWLPLLRDRRWEIRSPLLLRRVLEQLRRRWWSLS